MPRILDLTSFNQTTEHIHDDLSNQGYNYERHILLNVMSLEMFANPVNDVPYRLIERLFEHLINAVRLIKLTYAIAFPKNSKNIN